jgi:hypothetical protein
MEEAMVLRVGFVAATAVALAVLDVGLDAVLPTEGWGFHQRSPAWVALAASLLVIVVLLGALPSRLVALAAGLVAGGVLGNLGSARLHGGRVPNPIVLGTVALNLADVFVLAGVPVLVFALARVSIRHRDWIDRNIPPRRWELVLRRRIGL